MTVLAAKVKRREAGPVDGVDFRPLAAQDGGRLRVTPPGRLVQSAVPVLSTTTTTTIVK